MAGDVLDRDGYALEFDECFTASELSAERWVTHYLPHWSTPERSRARYDVSSGVLRLRIDADQPAWRDDVDGLRVSNIQTGTVSGPSGSTLGQHRHAAGLTVVSAQPVRRLYTPTAGLAEAVLRASPDPTCMLAFWLVGFEEAAPEQSGEICVAELFGTAMGPHDSGVRIGVKAHHDPRLADDMEEVRLGIDGTTWHTYGAAWTADEVRFYVDDGLVRTVRQRLDYPLQLMVGHFEFPTGDARDPAAYPKVAEVAAVRGHRHAT